ncbi:MAG: thermonuclease family protein [Microgenomates group bacterium]
MCLSCLFSKQSISLILFALIFVSTIFQKIINPPSPQPTPSTEKIISASPSAQLVKVKRVIDGDTIEIESGQKIRYIGIDAPELHDPRKPVECFAREAFEKNKQLVEEKSVRLEKDVSEADKYGRLLRYVFVKNEATNSGEIFINEYLVANGYALTSTFPPDVKYALILKEAQEKARENNLGLWQRCQKKFKVIKNSKNTQRS